MPHAFAPAQALNAARRVEEEGQDQVVLAQFEDGQSVWKFYPVREVPESPSTRPERDDPTVGATVGLTGRSTRLPWVHGVGQVRHPRRRLRTDRLQRDLGRDHAVEQAGAGAEKHR